MNALGFKSEVLWRQGSHGGFIFDGRRGLSYVLNGVGAQIGGLIAGRTQLASIVAYVASHYEVTEQQAAADVAAFIDHLDYLGLLDDK